MNVLVTKLPSDGHQKEPSGEVVVNICGTLNNLVAGSSLAARDITFFDGLPKLVAIKSSHNSRLVNLVCQCSWFCYSLCLLFISNLLSGSCCLTMFFSYYSSGMLKAAKAASTVLFNMFQYNKLHKDYKQVRLTPFNIDIVIDGIGEQETGGSFGLLHCAWPSNLLSWSRWFFIFFMASNG